MKRVHPIVESGYPLPALASIAPIAQGSGVLRPIWAVGHDYARFAAGSQVLAWVKAETASVAKTADAPALVLRSMRLGGVFNDGEAVLPCDLQDRVHVRGMAVKVHRDDCPRAWGDHRFDTGGVDSERLGIDV